MKSAKNNAKELNNWNTTIELSKTIDKFFWILKAPLAQKGGVFFITCAIKATKIWDVLNVATVDGGIIVNDLVVQKKPNRPKMKHRRLR